MNYIISNFVALIFCVLFFYIHQFIKKHYQRKKNYKEFQEFLKILKDRENAEMQILINHLKIIHKQLLNQTK